MLPGMKQDKPQHPNRLPAGLYRGAWRRGDGVFKLFLNEDFLIEGLPDSAYTHQGWVVWDVRKSSMFKHGRFPGTQC
jgi:hypothetical protein